MIESNIVVKNPFGIIFLAGSIKVLLTNQTEVLEMLRRQGAPYLQNAILHRRIRDLAAVDDLTNVLNRRFGLRRLREEFTRAFRHGIPISVLMVDVDHFKDFNDQFGHDAGDMILKTVAASIESNIRTGDVLCRYGGEEFMVVAPGTGLTGCAKLAERLLRTIETTQFPWRTQHLSVTVSIGDLADDPGFRPQGIGDCSRQSLIFRKRGGSKSDCRFAGRPDFTGKCA